MGRCQCSARLIGGRFCTEAQDTGRVRTNDRLTACSPLNSFGMQYTHLTVDLQLYQTACLVQWNEPLCWTNVILHPGMMALMSFLGCIGTLMKASGVDILIGAAFAGLTSIVNGKAWTNALRAYRLIIAVLLQNFYSSGAKTYAELCVYLETAREHPTGSLWVDCLIKPTHVCRSVWRADIYQAKEGFWRYEGHFKWLCG